MHSNMLATEDVKGFKAESLNKFKVNLLSKGEVGRNIFGIHKKLVLSR